jgi:hypothetical protein
VKRLAGFLTIGILGVAALLLGLAVDAYLHARDPTLAHREGLFSLTNPGHVLLGIGIALVVVGVVGASYTSLPFGTWTRRAFLVGALAMVALSSGAQLQAAVQLIDSTRAAVARYKDERAAIQAGYSPMEPEGQPIMHYVNKAYMTAADVLRPDHVQSLIYFNSTHGPILIGAMYIMPSLATPGPQIGGALTVWHKHDQLCINKATGEIVAFAHDSSGSANDKSGTCPRGSSNGSTPEMLHVWLIDNPGGPFGSDMAPEVLASIT